MKLRFLLGGLVILLGIVGVFLAINRSSNAQKNGNQLSVVASFYPLYDFTKQVGGDKVDATNITPADAEPHDYDPSPQQLVTAEKAKVFVYDGATLEPWVNKFLPGYTATTVKASEGINLQTGTDENGVASSDIKDPHFWLDPQLAKTIVDNIRKGLSKADPKDSSFFAQQAESYKAKLDQLDKDFSNGLASCQSRTIITSHAAFGYLGKRYNLNVISIAGVSPDEEPSAAKLAELTKLIEDNHIKYVFFETLVSPRLAETLAQEAGAKTAVFDPIEGLSDADQKQGKDYLSVQKDNLQSLRTALDCQ